MGRSSSTGLPFLIERSDTRKFSYHRVVSDDLASLVAGPIDLLWASKIIELEGRAAIKISLKTGDEAMARIRWQSVHAQVEALVQLATIRVRSNRAADLAKRVSALQPAEIRAMAGQVRHDILADDDKTYIDPTFTTPLNEIVFDLLRKAGRADDGATKAEALSKAQDVQKRKAEGDLAARNIALFDQCIEEGEIDGDPSLIATLARFGTIENPVGLDATADESAQLDVELQDVRTIPSDVDVILAENGITISPHHPDRKALGLAILRAQIAASAMVEARRSGAPIDTPDRPAPMVLTSTPSKGPTLSAMRERWIELMKPGRKAVDDNRLYVEAFIEMVGDIAAASVTKKMIRDFRDLLKKRPRNMPRDIAKLPLADQVAWGDGKSGCRLLTAQTVNSKGIGAISAILEIAKAEDHLDANPCVGQLLPVDGPALERFPYSIADLNKIFSSPIYVDGKRWKAGCRDAAFWIPLIGLFAGARLEEIGQLLVDDIRIESGINFFDFIEFDDEAETAGLVGEEKDLKTAAARRRVPIHLILIELGFLRYVARMRAEKSRYVFPMLREYRGRRTHDWSKWWGRYTDQFVTKSARKVFHSFRHTFIDRMRNIFGNDDVAKPLVGHTKHTYGRVISLKTRHKIICGLDYPGVDFSTVRQAAKRLGL